VRICCLFCPTPRARVSVEGSCSYIAMGAVVRICCLFCPTPGALVSVEGSCSYIAMGAVVRICCLFCPPPGVLVSVEGSCSYIAMGAVVRICCLFCPARPEKLLAHTGGNTRTRRKHKNIQQLKVYPSVLKFFLPFCKKGPMFLFLCSCDHLPTVLLVKMFGFISRGNKLPLVFVTPSFFWKSTSHRFPKQNGFLVSGRPANKQKEVPGTPNRYFQTKTRGKGNISPSII